MAVNWTNITTVGSFLNEANTQTSGMFWASMLGLIYVVLLISLLPFGIYPAVISSSFVAFVLGIFLVYMGLVNWTIVASIAGIMIAIFLWIGYSSNKYK